MDAIEALQPVTNVLKIFGLSIVPSFQRKKFSFAWHIKCYSLLLTTFRTCIFVLALLTQMFYVRCRFRDMYATIDIILLCGVRLIEITNATEAFLKVRHEKQLIRNFIEIDNILMNRFNIQLKSNELRLSAIKRLIVWFCAIGFTLGGDLVLSQNKSYMFFFYLTYIPPFVTASLSYFQIIIWADLIRYRLHVVNRLLHDLNHSNHNEIIGSIFKLNGISQSLCISDLFGSLNGHFDSAYDARIFDHISIICNLYRRLWIQTNLVNERFKCSMVLNIGNDFVSLVSNLYFTIMCLKDHQSCTLTVAAVYFMNSIIHIFHVTMLSKTCHHATNEASNIAYGIHDNKHVSKNKRLSSFVRPKIKNNIHYIYLLIK